MNLEARVCDTKITIFVFWNAWTALMVTLSQSSSRNIDRTAYRFRHCADNQSDLVKASKNKANPKTDEVRVENKAAILNQSQFAVLHSRCSFSFFLSVNHYPREFNILQKKKKTLTSWAQHDKTLKETVAFPDKRKSLLVIQIRETLWRIN